MGKAGHWVLWVKAGTDDLMPMGSLLLGAPIEGGWAVHWEKQIDPRGAHFWDQSRSQLHLHCAYVSCACAIVHMYISSLYFTHFFHLGTFLVGNAGVKYFRHPLI